MVAWRQQKQSGPGGRRIKYQNRSVASSLFGEQRAEKNRSEFREESDENGWRILMIDSASLIREEEGRCLS